MSQATQVPIVLDGIRYVTAPNDAVPDGVRTGAIAQGRLVDELTNTPITAPITVSPAGVAFTNPRTRAAVNPRSADGGVVGLVGVPMQAVPAIRTTAYEVGVAVRVSGYVSTSRTLLLGPIPLFPTAFAPAPLGDIMMHREPAMLYGRANLRTATTFNGLPNATVRVSGIWRVAPTLTVSPPASPPNLVAMDPLMYAARPVGASVRTVTLTPNIASEKRLLRAAVAGATQVYLSDRAVLAANDVLGIDDGDPSRAEWVVVQSIVGAVSATEPAVATLAHPLARTHGAGALAHPTVVSAPIAAQPLAVDAIAGDTTLLLAAMAGMTPTTVEIVGGTPKPEYHTLSLYENITNADGQWRLPPLSRVAQITLAATHATATSPPRTVAMEYPRREQRLDLVFV